MGDKFSKGSLKPPTSLSSSSSELPAPLSTPLSPAPLLDIFAVGKSTLFGDDDNDDDPILGGNKKAAAPAKASPAAGSAAAKPTASSSKVCAPHAITKSIFTTFRSRCSGTTTTTTTLIRSQRHRNLLPSQRHRNLLRSPRHQNVLQSPLQPVHFPSHQHRLSRTS